MGKGSRRRPRQTSREEADFRDDYGRGKIKISLREFRKRIKIIRERTGKP